MNVTGNNQDIRAEAVPEQTTYFIRSENAIKIGTASDFKRRIQNLQVSNHRPLTILVVVPASVAGEYATHRKFDHLRITGEWFRAEPELLRFIDSIQRHNLDTGPSEIAVLQKQLGRLRSKCLPAQRHYISNLIVQLGNFHENPDNLRPRILANIRAIEAAH